MSKQTRTKAKNKQVLITQGELNKTIAEIRKKTIKEISNVSIFIFLAWLKDEQIIDNNPEALIENYQTLERWFQAIQDHTIDVELIRSIIENDTGLQIKVE